MHDLGENMVNLRHTLFTFVAYHF